LVEHHRFHEKRSIEAMAVELEAQIRRYEQLVERSTALRGYL